jgi:hypothetical protein
MVTCLGPRQLLPTHQWSMDTCAQRDMSGTRCASHKRRVAALIHHELAVCGNAFKLGDGAARWAGRRAFTQDAGKRPS